MSTRVVLIWLAVAIILGGVAVYLFQRGSSNTGASQGPVYAAGERLVQFSPADLEQIEFKAPDRTREVISRDPSTGGWKLALDKPTGAVSVPTAQTSVEWPVVESRVQGFLQTLLDTQTVSAPAKDAAIGGAPTVVRMRFKNGNAIQFNLSDRSLGGTGLVEVISESRVIGAADQSGISEPGKPRLALIDDWFHRVCRTPGPRAWRDQTALAMSRADVSRIHLESPTPGGLRTLALGRVDGRWRLREPVVAPADRGAVTRLLGTLGEVTITNFLDDGPGSTDTRLDKPAATVRLEYDLRSADGHSSVAKNELLIGGIASVGSGTSAVSDKTYAQVDGQRIVMIDPKPLAGLAMDPGAYIWPYPTDTNAADVGTVLLEVRTPDGGSVDFAPATAGTPAAQTSNQRVFRRSLERWVRINEDGSEGVLVDQSQAEVAALLAFLTGPGGEAAGKGVASAATISVVQPTRFVPFGRITLLSIGAGELERIEIAESGSGLITLRTGEVYRTYPEDRLPVLLAELRARAKAAGVPIEGFGAASGHQSTEPTK